MIGTIAVRVSAAHPDIPLREIPVFVGSACSVGVVEAPSYFGGVIVSGISVSIQNATGETSTVLAKLSGKMWVATFGPDHFRASGSVRNGLTVTAHGKAEDGETVQEWTLGKGNVCVMEADGAPSPGMSWQNVHLMDEVPDEPQKGDLAKVDGAWRIYTGSSWDAIGGGVSAYDDLTNKPKINGHELTGNKTAADLGLATSDDVGSVGDTASMALNGLSQHAGNTDNPHDVTAEQIGTYTQAEIDDKITRFVAHYLTAKNAEGRFVPFATHAALAYAKTHHTEDAPQFFYAGQGFTPTKNDYCVVLADETYEGKTTRYSFVGDWPTGQFQYQYTINDTAFSKSQWDAINSGVTEDKVAEIDKKADEFKAWEHGELPEGVELEDQPYYGPQGFWIWRQKNSSTVWLGSYDKTAESSYFNNSGRNFRATRKRVLYTGDAATEEQVDIVSKTSAYPIGVVTGGELKDRTINHASAGGTFTFPVRTGSNARDFVLVIDALTTPPTVIFPAGVTYVSEQDAADVWTAEADKVNAWYFSEQTDGVFMACHKAMSVISQ